MIIIGYQGIGKTTVCKDNLRYIDFESSALRIPDDWHIPYCQMAIELSRQGYVVFVSSHEEVRRYLQWYSGICVAIVPSPKLENDWIKKLKERAEQSESLKDERAYIRALACYQEDIVDIMHDCDTKIIKTMDYNLKQIIEKIEEARR